MSDSVRSHRRQPTGRPSPWDSPGNDTGLLRVLGLQADPTSPFWRSALGFLCREWSWSWNSSTLATSCEELTHWKRLWCWEGLGAGGEGDNRGWDGWMASLTWWTWVWVNSGSWWWTGRPGVLRFVGSQTWTRLSDWSDLIWSEQWCWILFNKVEAHITHNLMSFVFFHLIMLSLHKFSQNITFFLSCSATQSCPTLWGPMDCSPPGCSVHGILQVRILQWVASSSYTRSWIHPKE